MPTNIPVYRPIVSTVTILILVLFTGLLHNKGEEEGNDTDASNTPDPCDKQ